MKLVRFRSGWSDYWGVLEDTAVYYVPDAPFALAGEREFAGNLDELELLVPVKPGKIVCVGLNYTAHVTERDPNRKVPTEPVLFMKPQTALVRTGDPIQIANPGHQTHHEAELVVVIGRTASRIFHGNPLDYVLGYTCGNDVSDRDLQGQDGQFVRAKGFNTYAPIGPWIETELEPGNLSISSRVNGEVRQNSSTSKMIWSVEQLVTFISGVMTLEPGDIIMTGTPEGVGPLVERDTVEITVEGIGTLSNPVVNREADPVPAILGNRVGPGGD